jgi:RNA polymerase sigma factor (TIGR02999 family)
MVSRCSSPGLSGNCPGVSEVTRILERVQQGDPKAAEELMPLVYEELRKLAARKMAHEKPGHTLQATALVHEAWLRLSESTRQEWRGREHFFRAAAEAMRRIQVDNARRKLRLRHGGGLERIELDWMELPIAADDDKCLRVDEALDRLAATDPKKAEIIKLRVFAGLKVAEIAALLDCSEKTVQRDWNFAKAWISRELQR